MANWLKKWQQFREAMVIIDDLDVVLQIWGLTPARFATAVSILIAALFITLGQGIAWALFAAIMVFPAVVWGLIGIREFRDRNLRPPNFDRWSKVKILSIWQAASLWAGKNPSPVITPSSASYPYLQQLKSAAEAGELKTVDDIQNLKGRVHRDELIRYADSVDEKPQFLFPNEPP